MRDYTGFDDTAQMAVLPRRGASEGTRVSLLPRPVTPSGPVSGPVSGAGAVTPMPQWSGYPSSGPARAGMGLFDGTVPLESDGPEATTNVYNMARYTYRLTVQAASMSDHELGLLLPRSGRIWFNAKLFTDVPRGTELGQRDAWWRAVDASPSVRFLLAWCLSAYRVAQFHQTRRDQLPTWSRVLHFSPAPPDSSRMLLHFISDVAQDVTALLAPPARVWQHMQEVATIQAGDRRWHNKLVLANQSADSVLHMLADRSNCPRSLVQRALDGNPAIESAEDYCAFTESLIADLPRLHMLRLIAMQQGGGAEANPRATYPPRTTQPPSGRVGVLRVLRPTGAPAAARVETAPWYLHL